MRHDHPRPGDPKSQPFKIIYRGEMLPLTLEHIDRYEAAGRPFGESIEGVLLWMQYRGKARGN